MKIAIVTFDGFNEIDSLVPVNILNRVDVPDWEVAITSASDSICSMNGVQMGVQQPLEFANSADAVLIGSGRRTLEIAGDPELLARLQLDPAHQLLGSQCSGALILARLGLLDEQPVCTDRGTRPLVEAEGIEVLDQAFNCRGNVATAGGCLAAHYLAFWFIWRLVGRSAAERALNCVVPVGEEERYIAHAVEAIAVGVDSPETAVARQH